MTVYNYIHVSHKNMFFPGTHGVLKHNVDRSRLQFVKLCCLAWEMLVYTETQDNPIKTSHKTKHLHMGVAPTVTESAAVNLTGQNKPKLRKLKHD